MATLGTFNENDREGYISLAKATELAAEKRRLVKIEGVDPRTKGMTFGNLFNRWLKSHAKLKKKSWEADIGLYERHIATRLGSHELGALKRRNVIDVLDNIATEVSGVQANRCQTLVSSVLNWALDEDLLEANPAHGVRQRGHETPRERVMTEARAAGILECPHWLATG